MKTLVKSLASLVLLAFFTAPALVRSQDVPPPPPSDQANQAPPPPGDQAGPGDQGDQGDQGASFQTFYDQLGDQGQWVQTDNYGYVFQPNVQDPDWAPYTQGHWVYTDVGWTWVSNEPWGWATYHYGRWANIDGFGWVWVPGYRWAPAWVSWRYGGGYAGWAPLPPETEYGQPGISVDLGFHFGGDVDVAFNIGAGCYNFVQVGYLGDPDYRGRYVNRYNNYTIINRTTNITNITVNRNAGRNFQGVNVGGPSLNTVNAHAHHPVQTVQLTAANQPGRSTLQGNSLAIFAPKVNPGTVHQARPARVAQTLNNSVINRGASITQPLAVTANVKPPPPSAELVKAAQTAQLHAPASAKIVTEKNTPRTTFAKPYAPQEQVPPLNAEHNAANAAFTGEQAKPHVSQPNETAPAQTFHQSTVNSNGEHNSAPFNGETVKPQGTQPSQAAPAQTFHQPTANPNAESEAQQQAQQQALQQKQAEQQARQQQQAQQQARQQSPSYKPNSGSTNNAPGR